MKEREEDEAWRNCFVCVGEFSSFFFLSFWHKKSPRSKNVKEAVKCKYFQHNIKADEIVLINFFLIFRHPNEKLFQKAFKWMGEVFSQSKPC